MTRGPELLVALIGVVATLGGTWLGGYLSREPIDRQLEHQDRVDKHVRLR